MHYIQQSPSTNPHLRRSAPLEPPPHPAYLNLLASLSDSSNTRISSSLTRIQRKISTYPTMTFQLSSPFPPLFHISLENLKHTRALDVADNASCSIVHKFDADLCYTSTRTYPFLPRQKLYSPERTCEKEGLVGWARTYLCGRAHELP